MSKTPGQLTRLRKQRNELLNLCREVLSFIERITISVPPEDLEKAMRLEDRLNEALKPRVKP